MSEELMNLISTIILVPLTTIITSFLVAVLRKGLQKMNSEIKSEKLKDILSQAEGIIEQSVSTVGQVYVSTLKKNNAFTREAQTEAFNNAKNIALTMMSDEAKKLITKNYGDFDVWIKTKIEQAVSASK